MDLMDEFQARRLVNTYADMILRISYQYLKQTCDAVFSLRILGTESIVNPFDCHSRSKPPITPLLCVIPSGVLGCNAFLLMCLSA